MKHARAFALSLGACLVLLSPLLLLSLAGDYTPHLSVGYRVARADAPWSTNVRVNDDAGTVGQASPAIAVDAAGNAYAVWQDKRNGDWDIYFSRRDATTGVWGPNERVNDDTDAAEQWIPHIAVDAAGNAYAVWPDRRDDTLRDIYFSRRDAATGAWGGNVRVNDDTGTAGQSTPDIAVDAAGNAYALWMDYRSGNPDIYFSRRDAATGAWSASVRVNDDTGTMDQGATRIVVDALGNAYAVWEDRRSGYSDIYFSRRDAATGAWSANVKVNDDAGTAAQNYPTIAVDSSGNAYVLWSDTRYYAKFIYFSRRDAATGDWGANVRVDAEVGTGSQYSPAIAVDSSGNAYAVWGNYRNGRYGNADIYFSRRDAATGAWGANVRVNDDTGTAGQGAPAIAVDAAGNAYAVWEDYRNGNYDIYFAFSHFWRSDLPNRVYLPFVASSSAGW